jgi:hypothetical protein
MRIISFWEEKFQVFFTFYDSLLSRNHIHKNGNIANKLVFSLKNGIVIEDNCLYLSMYHVAKFLWKTKECTRDSSQFNSIIKFSTTRFSDIAVASCHHNERWKSETWDVHWIPNCIYSAHRPSAILNVECESSRLKQRLLVYNKLQFYLNSFLHLFDCLTAIMSVRNVLFISYFFNYLLH